MTSCGLAHNYQHLEDLVASISSVVEKDFDTLKSVLRMEAAGCCETLGTTHKSTLRYIVILAEPSFSVSIWTYIYDHKHNAYVFSVKKDWW